MRSNTDRKPSRLAPVLAALGTILVVFILVGTMLWAFLSAGGAIPSRWASWPCTAWWGWRWWEECWPP